jgi:hypothetical protein
MSSEGAAVTLINVVEIPADQIDQFTIGWKQARRHHEHVARVS